MKTSTPKYCLLVDDDPDQQEIFLTAAQEVNPNLICKYEQDPEQAFELLRHDTPDIIFLDVNMPKIDGFEFIIHLKCDDRLRSIPVIFYSTLSDEKQIERATTLGAHGFITKTNNYNHLCKLLSMFLK
jgi:CheY-like chemotaxis protein